MQNKIYLLCVCKRQSKIASIYSVLGNLAIRKIGFCLLCFCNSESNIGLHLLCFWQFGEQARLIFTVFFVIRRGRKCILFGEANTAFLFDFGVQELRGTIVSGSKTLHPDANCAAAVFDCSAHSHRQLHLRSNQSAL